MIGELWGGPQDGTKLAIQDNQQHIRWPIVNELQFTELYETNNHPPELEPFYCHLYERDGWRISDPECIVFKYKGVVTV